MENYRPNVAAILRKPKSGKILICQRRGQSSCWHFPQGGVGKGEDLIGALHREVREEIGVGPEKYTIVSCRTGYRYKFDEGHLKKGLFCGQEQTYFLCDYFGKKKSISLNTHVQEFKGAMWIFPSEFRLEWIPPFKHAVFIQLFKDFFAVNLVAPVSVYENTFCD